MSDFFSGIACPTATTCFASAWHLGDVGDVLTSADGGATWAVQAAATTAAGSKLLHAISCPSTSVCFAVGVSGTVINTVDGGVHWTGQTSNTANDLFGVNCPSASVCYAVGVKATVTKTTDGGAHWSATQVPATTGELDGVSCTSLTRCFASSPHGEFALVGKESPLSAGRLARIRPDLTQRSHP